MAVETAAILAQLDDLLSQYEQARNDQIAPWLLHRARLYAAGMRLSPPGSPHRALVESAAAMTRPDAAAYALAQVLHGLRADVAAGYTQDFRDLVHAALFEDFLAMAEELQSKDYDAAAAVIAGSVLEEHLRKLAEKRAVGPSHSVDRLSADLVKAGAFSEPQRKIVAGWYAQRTEAAHGRHANVVHEEVGRMIAGVRDFLVRYPA
jgi:hypothetical protein